MFWESIKFILLTEGTFKLTFPQLWHIIITAKECSKILYGERKPPEVVTLGAFLLVTVS